MAIRRILVLAAMGFAANLAIAQQQGVGRNEIVVGTIQDLSGPLAGYGKQARNGMMLRVEEANEQGGLYERKLRLVVEDSGYDPKKAVLAAQKMLGQDRIFAMLGHLGTTQNNAVMPLLFEKNVPNMLPLAASLDMYEPAHRLKYAFMSSYFDQVRLALPVLAREKGAERVCIIYQDDDFGQEVLKGAEAGMKTLGGELAERTSFKRGATEFSSQVARLKAANCQLVVLGTIIRETVGAVTEARKIGFDPVFLGSVAAYSDLIHKLGGKAVEGIYATMTAQTPYLDEADVTIRFWAAKYKTRFGEDPTIFSVYGYTIVDMFIKGLRKTGPDLNTANFIRAMDQASFAGDMFGAPRMRFSPTQRLGSSASRLSQIQGGRWKVVSDYIGGTSAPLHTASTAPGTRARPQP